MMMKTWKEQEEIEEKEEKQKKVGLFSERWCLVMMKYI